MQLSDLPKKLPLAFAATGNKNEIPVNSQVGIVPGAASLADGFPPLTMTPVAAGGVPPSGLDMNGILYKLSLLVRWLNAGAGFTYDATFATDSHVAGYPAGARIARSDGMGYWLNTVDGNKVDPESTTPGAAVAAGWVPDMTNGISSVTMTNANVTLTPLQYGRPIIKISGALASNLNLIFPAIAGSWIIRNATSNGYNITCKTPSGTGAIVPQNKVTLIICDGVNIYATPITNRVNVKDSPFNAIGDGTTDDTAAIQAALNTLIGGGICELPKGNYKISSLTIPDGVSIVGEGAFASVLVTNSATANVLTFGISSGIFNLKISSSVTKTSGFYVDVQGNGGVISNCEFDGYYIAISVGTVGNPVIVGTIVENCEFRLPNTGAGSGAVQFLNFSNGEMRNCIITGSAGTQPGFGVRYQNGDTAFLTDCNITLHGRALLIDTPPTLNVYALTIANCVFDSAGTIAGGVAVSSAEIVPSGGVYDTRISNCWFGLSASKFGCHIIPVGAGIVDGIVFSGCEFTKNGDGGFIANGTGVKNWFINGGFSTGNVNSGLRASGGTSNFTIVGHTAGNIAGRGANNYGIKVDNAASDNYLIANNNVVGNTTAGIQDEGTGTNARVIDNLGYNGIANVSGLTVGASPWSYTSGHYPETIYIAGGTVSEIKIDGQIVQNTTGSTIQLMPNETMSITYSTLPTVLRKKN